MTVYRTLDWLKQIGLARPVLTGEGMERVELVPAERHTHHLVCDGCGAVRTVSVCGLDRTIAERIEREHGFQVDHHQLVFQAAARSAPAPAARRLPSSLANHLQIEGSRVSFRALERAGGPPHVPGTTWLHERFLPAPAGSLYRRAAAGVRRPLPADAAGGALRPPARPRPLAGGGVHGGLRPAGGRPHARRGARAGRRAAWVPVVLGTMVWGAGITHVGGWLPEQVAGVLGSVLLAGGMAWNARLRHEASCRAAGVRRIPTTAERLLNCGFGRAPGWRRGRASAP